MECIIECIIYPLVDALSNIFLLKIRTLEYRRCFVNLFCKMNEKTDTNDDNDYFDSNSIWDF